jgi:hypothetical protein
MSKSEKRSEIGDHNAGITARPRIYFRVRPGDWDHVIGIAPRSREFTSAYATPGTPENKELEHSTTKKDRNRLRALRLLRYVCAEDDQTAARKVLTDAGQLIFEDLQLAKLFAGTEDPKQVAAASYEEFFNDEIRGARLAIHRTKRGEFVPIIRCPDVKTAMFMFAAFRGIETCLNCAKLFAVDIVRPDDSSSERYCTAACGQRYRQKLYRLREKGRLEKISKRKGKK